MQLEFALGYLAPAFYTTISIPPNLEPIRQLGLTRFEICCRGGNAQPQPRPRQPVVYKKQQNQAATASA